MSRADVDPAPGARTFRQEVLAFLTLRPYGESMLTPAVRQWLAFSWAVVFLMSLIEGTVWGIVSRYFVPAGERGWVTWVLAPLFFLGVFVVIWVVDVSFVTSERPESAADRGADARGARPIGAAPWERVRWWLGVVVRMLIVLISLLITAPFLTQVIRSNEVAESYRALLDRTRRDWEVRLTAQEDQRVQTLTRRQSDLKSEQARLDKTVEAGAGRDTAKRIKDLEATLRAAEQEFQAEMTGLDGRRRGRGPKAKAADERKTQAQGQLEALTRELTEGDTANQRRLREITMELGKIDADLAQANTDKAGKGAQLAGLSSEDLARKYGFTLPGDTIGVRAGLLADLRARDLAAERDRYESRNPGGRFGWFQWLGFHFGTVEGLSQALLGILFLALIVLKTFEPKAVRLYFNETLQYQWRRYLDGVFDRVPGFRPSGDPDRHDHFEFARVYRDFAADPDAFWRRQESDHRAREALADLERERRYQDEMVQRRLQEADDHLDHERERQRIAREDELHNLAQRAAEIEAQHRYAEEERQRTAETLAAEAQRQRALAEQEFAARQALAVRELDERKAALQTEYQEQGRRQGMETDAQRRRLEAELNARLDALERERQAELRRLADEQQARDAELAQAAELRRLEVLRVQAALDLDRSESAERLAREQQAALARIGIERERHEGELEQLRQRGAELAEAARLEQEARAAELEAARGRLEREHQDWLRARGAEDRATERNRYAALVARAAERIAALESRLGPLDARAAEVAAALAALDAERERLESERSGEAAGLERLAHQIGAARAALDEELGRGPESRPAVRDEISLRLDEYRREEPIRRKRLGEIAASAVRLSAEREALGAAQATLAQEREAVLDALGRRRGERECAEDALAALGS